MDSAQHDRVARAFPIPRDISRSVQTLCQAGPAPREQRGPPLGETTLHGHLIIGMPILCMTTDDPGTPHPKSLGERRCYRPTGVPAAPRRAAVNGRVGATQEKQIKYGTQPDL